MEKKGGTNKQHLIVLPDFQNTLSLHLVGISFVSSPVYNHSYYQFVSVSSSFMMHVNFSPNSFYMKNPVITNSTQYSKILTNIYTTVQFTNFSHIYLYFQSFFYNRYFLFFYLVKCVARLTVFNVSICFFSSSASKEFCHLKFQGLFHITENRFFSFRQELPI